MRIQQATSRADIRGDNTCRHCRKSIKPGEYYASTQMPNNPITDRWFHLHVKCMKEMVADVPEDTDRVREGFESLREKILVSGNLFPN